MLPTYAGPRLPAGSMSNPDTPCKCNTCGCKWDAISTACSDEAPTLDDPFCPECGSDDFD